MPEPQEPSKLDTLEKITRIASNLSVILGVIFVLVGIYNAINEGSRAVKSLKLSSLPHIDNLITRDTELRPRIKEFLDEYDSHKLMGLLSKYETGERVYLSDDLSDFREIGRHYDRVGALVKLDYIDFDLLFAVIPFPDDFWEETRVFRVEIRTRKWDEDGGLPDFWENFEYLGQLYEEAREAEDRKRKEKALLTKK